MSQKDDEKGHNPLRDVLDEMSVRQLRYLVEQLAVAYEAREKDAPPERKYAGRTAQKLIAQLLADLDCDWRVRELLLNMGRTLYYSTEARHQYYQEALINIVCEAAKNLKRESDGSRFKAAVIRLEDLLRSGGGVVHAPAEGLAANQDVVTIASAIVRDALTKDPNCFSKSERRLLSGVVDSQTARLLRMDE